MFAVEIELQFNPNVTGSLVQAMGSSGFVQFPESDLKYLTRPQRSIQGLSESLSLHSMGREFFPC